MDNSNLKLALPSHFKPQALIICKQGSLTNIFQALENNHLPYETYHDCFVTTDIVVNNVSSQSYDKDIVINYLSRIIAADLLFFASVDSFTRTMNLIEPYLVSYIALRKIHPKSALTASFLESNLTKTNLSSKTESTDFKDSFARNLVAFFQDFLWLTPGQITQNAILQYFKTKGCSSELDKIQQQLVGAFSHGITKLGYQAALRNWLMESFEGKEDSDSVHSAYKLVVLGNAQSTVKYDLLTKHILHELFLDDLVHIDVTTLPLYSTEFDANKFIVFLQNYLEDYECQCSCQLNSHINNQSNSHNNSHNNNQAQTVEQQDNNLDTNLGANLDAKTDSALRFDPQQPHILFVSKSKIAELLLTKYPEYVKWFDYLIFLHGSGELNPIITQTYTQVFPSLNSCAVETLFGYQASFKRFKAKANTSDQLHNTQELPDLILPLNLEFSTLKDIILYLNSRCA